MVSRLAFSRVAPGFRNARLPTTSLRSLRLARGYASEAEHSVRWH